MHVPENFDIAVTQIETCLVWNTLSNDWDKLSFHERATRWNLFCDDIVRTAYKTRPYCIRCDECCKKAPPTFHQEDKELFDKGLLKRTDVYTLRSAEMVHSRIENRSYPLKEEMIKVKGKPETGECVFLTREGCSIYEHRPIQCKRFECWNPRNLINTFKGNKLTRKDIVHHSEIMAYYSLS